MDNESSAYLDLGIASVEFTGSEEWVENSFESFVGDTELAQLILDLKRMDYDLAEEHESNEAETPPSGTFQ